MAPAEVARTVRLRLVAQIADDLAALGDLAAAVARLIEPMSDERGEWMRCLALAFEVERYFTASEAMLTRVLRDIDGEVPTGPSSHQELLRACAVPLEYGRPAVISRFAATDLRELLKFRHFARHGYEAEPELARMTEHAERVARVQLALTESLNALVTWLRQPDEPA